MPVEATQHTQAGAVAFAKFFIQTIDWGYATTSATYMKHYFQASCVTCRSIQKGIEDAVGKHRHFDGDRITVTRVYDLASQNLKVVTGVVMYRVSTAVLYESDGTFVTGEPALTLRNRIALAWTLSGWSVTDFVPLK